MAFGSKFFSIAGQKERVGNVVKYGQLAASKATFGLIPVPKNTDMNYKSNTALGKVGDFLVNNPKTSAAVVTAGVYAGRYAPEAIKKTTAFVKEKTGTLPGREKTPKTKSPGRKGLEQVPQQGGLIKPETPVSPEPQSPQGGVITPSASTSPRKTATRRTTAPRKRRRVAAKPRKRRSTRKVKRKGSKKRTTKRKKRVGTAKQYARKGGKSVKYTKNGQPYIILSDGRARFVKGKRK